MAMAHKKRYDSSAGGPARIVQSADVPDRTADEEQSDGITAIGEHGSDR